MLFESANQGIIFLTMVYFGFMSGIIDKAPELFVTKFKHKWIHFIGDVLRPVCFAIIFFLGVCLCNYGEIRFYCLIACILGFWLEKKFFEKPLIKIWNICWSKIKLVYNFIFKRKKKIESKE